MKSVTAQNPYGFCPVCGAPGVSRERCPHGNDTCVNNHYYASAAAILLPVQQIGNETLRTILSDLDALRERLKKHIDDMEAIQGNWKNI